jgi:glycosyltransferase involved in cell wall biosynthesis
VTIVHARGLGCADGVSFVVPVRNGAGSLTDTLQSILAQRGRRPLELVAIDDGSVDGSLALLEKFAREHSPSLTIRLIRGTGGGAAAAINAGVRAARYPIVCQIDQDVRLDPEWLTRVTAMFDDPGMGAVQGYYETDPESSTWSRVMGLDLEQRYASIARATDHVCTGNAAYRTDALLRVGLFDEAMGYGYDNDMSYRLRAAGYQLGFCRTARAMHRWRDGLAGYIVQQYGFGYGRMDLVAKHRHRVAGDSVSPRTMMLHPVLMSLAVMALASWAALTALGIPETWLLASGAAVVGFLIAERGVAGVRAARRFGDSAALGFPVIHLLRDLAWVAAMATWSIRRLLGRPARPGHSMRPRKARRELSLPASRAATLPATPRTIAIIPAHNEAANLESVVASIARHRPHMTVLVVDDGSSDGTAALARKLGVRSIHFSERMGIGSAMRAGLRYAARLGYDVAVRLDGDGQHDGADIEALLEPLRTHDADVVIGTRYGGASGAAIGANGTGRFRLGRVPLALCLTALTYRRVTDPTSGFCAFGPAAIRLLSEHHPDGYAEPELRLFLSRNGLRAIEVPVRTRPRAPLEPA